RDSGFGIRDSGFGIRDSGFGIRLNFVFLRTNSVNTYCTSTSFNSIPTNTSDFNSEALPRFKGKAHLHKNKKAWSTATKPFN
ncbi:hypothetical protein, partial [Vibrio owensii]|uniref:hypothetical protein n=1 Tax=Vibrio owensii TaxID=696485 RepID=UPI001D106840